MSARRRGRREPHAPSPPAPDAAPGFRIEVVPEFAGGLLYGRHDAILQGRVIAPAPIEAISLRQAGTVLGDIEFPPEPTGAVAAGTGGRTRGFTFTIPRPAGEAPLTWDFSVQARTTDGQTRGADFAARRDPTEGGGRLEAGPAWTEAGEAPAPPILAYVERAALDPAGNLVVSGWAVSEAPLITVQVFLDEERVGAALLGGARNDLGDPTPSIRTPRAPASCSPRRSVPRARAPHA